MLKLSSDYRSKIKPYRVFFTWDITYKCNYRCSYCDFNENHGWHEPCQTIELDIQKWFEIWENIYKRYGSCEIHFAGGEPFVYPNFMELIEGLSLIHTLEFSTNLFWEPEKFIKRIRPGRARIGVSFHPEFVSFDVFLNKVNKLKNAGFEIWVNYVGYPPILEGAEEYKKKFEKLGVFMNVLPFKGYYDGRRYPEEYTDREKKQLEKLCNYPWTEKAMNFSINKEKVNKDNNPKLCRMGQMYAKVHSDGEVFSCCAKSAKRLGNLIDRTFFLLEEPILCNEENCPCWKRMTVENEEYWFEHWVVPEDARSLLKEKK